MRKKYIGFIFVMAVCCYCVVILRYIGGSSESDMSLDASSIHTTCISQTQKNVRHTHAAPPAYDSRAAYKESVPVTRSVGSTVFHSTGGVVPSHPVESTTIGQPATSIAPAYPTLAHSTGHGYTASGARLHSYGAQGGSGGGNGRSQRTGSKSTGSGASVSGVASVSPLRNKDTYHGFTTVASELSGSTLADDTDVQDVPSRRNVSPGVPPFAPVGDAVLPLLLLMAIHIGRKSRGSR
ncbi:MAG: hypothetical protein ACI4TV_03705 [Paludibacteraceae bacterium]